MARSKLSSVITGLSLVCMLTTSGASAKDAPRTPPQCFSSHGWSGWRITPDARSMYIRAGVRDVYRLDFSGACQGARTAGSHLVTRIRGSSSICSPVDLDLKVADNHGFATPCIVNKITPLAADEASALPKNLRP